MRSETFVTVVLVIKNQTEQLIVYLDKLSPYLDERYSDYEIVIIDQNSNDNIENKLLEPLSLYQSIRHIRLSQEVSSDVALAAGIENAIGDFVVNLNIESDNIKLVQFLVEKGLTGNDIVICVSKKVTSFLYKELRGLSTWLLQSIGYSLPNNSTGTFCFSRRAVNAITESGRFYCKLHMRIANTGYPLYVFDSDNYIVRPQRKNIVSGIKEALHHMIFNSTKPLRWMSFLGVMGSLLAMLFSIYSLIVHFLNDQVASGWTTTILFMSSLFAILFIMLSFFGEYLARLLNDRSEHKEYNVVYERNSSVMLNENRSNVSFSSIGGKQDNSQKAIINRPLYYQVPKYEQSFTFPKKHDYCVAVFVINEGKKLHKQLQRMQELNLSVDIVIADGGSTDGSTDTQTLKNSGVNTLLVKKEDGKLGSQMRIAFSWAMENGYKGVIVIDGNNKDSVENINDFVEKLELGYDHIQGSRFIPGGKAINTPTSRILGLKLLHVPMMRLASGFKYTDTTNGFRAYSKELLVANNMAVFRDVFTSYEFHYYLAIEAAKQGYMCLEIPVTRTYPKGKVPTKISPIKGNLGVIKILLETCLGKYSI